MTPEELKKKRIEDSNRDFQSVMETLVGRRFIWRLLELTDNPVACFNTNHTQATKNIALRDFGRSELTLRAMDLCIENYVLMLRENAHLAQKDNS